MELRSKIAARLIDMIDITEGDLPSIQSKLKEALGELLKGYILESCDDLVCGLTPFEILTLKTTGKIACIKLYRDRTASGLKESKDFVEDAMRKTGITPPSFSA